MSNLVTLLSWLKMYEQREMERKEEAYECALCRISGLEDHIPAKKKGQMSHKLWWKKVSVNFAVGSSNPSQMKRRIETMKKRQR